MKELKRKASSISLDYSFVQNIQNLLVGIGILSKIKIKDNRHIDVKFTSKLL
jgi:hypothetical protein